MNPSHYPSPELCKKLRKISFPYSNLAWFGTTKNGGNTILIDCGEIEGYSRYSCPSVMEMLDMIPQKLVIVDEECYLTMDYAMDIIYYESGRGISTKCFVLSSIPNALAEMILWLHENKYISFTK